MSNVSASKVDGIIKALSGLEDDIDSLNSKTADMKKNLESKAQKEIEKLLEETRQMATKEAENIISKARDKAKSESETILKTGNDSVSKIKAKIDEKFDESVDTVVSTVLKA